MCLEFFGYKISKKKKTVVSVSICCSIGGLMKGIYVSTENVISTYVVYFILLIDIVKI
jgi:hypothetical protein